MATLVLTLGAASSSWADGGSGNCGVTSCNIGGGSGGGQGGGGGSGGGGGGQGGSGGGGSSGGGGGCANTYKKVSDTQLADLQRQGPGALPAQPTLGPGQTADLYYVYDCNGNPTGQIVYIVSGGGGAPVVGNPTPPVNPAVLAAQALKNIPLPAPHIHTNPDITQDQMVGLPIWLWVDAGDLGTKSDSVSAGPVTVTGTLNATSVVWNMGNGDTVTCSGPGTPYDPANPTATPPCGYSYRHSSAAQPNEAYTVTASVTWVGNYTVAGAPGSGPLGPVTRTSTTTVRVAEGQAINNG